MSIPKNTIAAPTNQIKAFAIEEGEHSIAKYRYVYLKEDAIYDSINEAIPIESQQPEDVLAAKFLAHTIIHIELAVGEYYLRIARPFHIFLISRLKEIFQTVHPHGDNLNVIWP